jgi:CheY-like chemotaxis protein
VVDDTLENRLLLSRLLREVGFQVREASNGEEAIRLWLDWEPHLIWMDMRMPVMDGYEATRKSREMDGPPVKIIALTASAFQHEKEKIVSMGCDGFVTKPFRSATLFEAIAEHLQVQFRYDDDATEDSTQHVELAKDRIAALPTDVVDALRHAMLTGNVKDAHDSVDRIQEHDESLANQLGRLIRAFRFDEVLDAIE